MKTQIFIFFISVFTLSALTAGNPTVITEKSKSLIVETSAWKSDKVNVQIKEATGAVILDETVKNIKGLRKYNLKNLPQGKYTLELSNELRITSQDFVIEANDLILSPEIRTTYKPVILWNSNYFDVNLMTLGKKAFINITDKDNNIIFAEKLESPSVHKRYDISGLTSGDYTISVAMDGRSFVSNYSK